MVYEYSRETLSVFDPVEHCGFPIGLKAHLRPIQLEVWANLGRKAVQDRSSLTCSFTSRVDEIHSTSLQSIDTPI